MYIKVIKDGYNATLRSMGAIWGTSACPITVGLY